MCSIIKLVTIAFDETSSYWSAPKSSKFLGFSLVVTRLSDYHWSAFRNHEGSTFTEKDRNKLNYRIGAELITSYCSYARSAQPGQIRTRLCGPWIAAQAGCVIVLCDMPQSLFLYIVVYFRFLCLIRIFSFLYSMRLLHLETSNMLRFKTGVDKQCNRQRVHYVFVNKLKI